MDIGVDIKKLQAGNDPEFELFFSLYFPYFMSFAVSYVNAEDKCKDIVQEVFIAYWKNHENFTDFVSLKVFFYRSIRNRCLNVLKKERVHTDSPKELEYLKSSDFLEENVIREEMAMILHSRIAKLKPQERRVMLLSLAGKSNPEIAEIMSLSLNTVKTHKLKAYSRLRDQLKDLFMLLSLL